MGPASSALGMQGPEVVAVAARIGWASTILCAEVIRALLVHLCHLLCLRLTLRGAQLEAAGDDGFRHGRTRLKVYVDYVGHRTLATLGYFGVNFIG